MLLKTIVGHVSDNVWIGQLWCLKFFKLLHERTFLLFVLKTVACCRVLDSK